MASTTIWPIEPHTLAKHEILRRYLQAWLPILSQAGHSNLLYIDGFAGPGQYQGGEEGSPLIAIRSILEHKTPIQSQIFLHFVELDKRRADFLKTRLEQVQTPENLFTKVHEGDFAEAFPKIEQEMLGKFDSLPATFAFIDPFGWKVPFEHVRSVLKYRNCEVFINFMYEEVNRFLSHQDQPGNFDSFFGTGEWREGMSLTTPRDRNRFLHDLYSRQLKTAGAKYVRSFEMKNSSNLVDYYLFYATSSYLGLKKMKEAMWHADPLGSFQFSDATDPNQSVLFGNEPDFGLLQRMIVKRFTGKHASIKQIEKFVVEETAFRETHFKRILKHMEMEGSPQLTVIDAPASRRRGTFADGVRVLIH
jgi:three-Cys-motif partner protein